MKSLSRSLLWRGALAIVVGVIAFAWPNITVGAFVILFAVYAFLAATMEFAFAFRSGETAGERALLGLTGLVSIALGVAFTARPDIGAITIAQVYGLFSLVSGVSSIVVATDLPRSTQVAPVAQLAA